MSSFRVYTATMNLLTLNSVRQSILEYSPREIAPGTRTRQAAVSVVLRPTASDTEALFILRAKKDGDPWSGHMAFPGGHHETDDESLRHTAERETYEEIGLNLTAHGEFIGQIDPVQANPRGRDLDIIVTPFVYELKQPEVRLVPNYEVADVLWGSLNEMHTGEAHTSGEFMVAGESVSYTGYGVGDEVVWGLTYRMLDLFFAVLDPDWQPRL